ncbi:CAP domain-containing protein [Lactiplantibacillus daowaiensis]|uniref:CAP domain-containing protein n=1 Tax=Lactiplantibacillus daowaiensis TaxID=2559918 RepID=A0ABW1RX09_9LACO|nr:CAP domain-containing protein [Lactiplantibacillus daowaiensis]
MKLVKLVSTVMVATTLGATATVITPKIDITAQAKTKKKTKKAKSERKYYTASQWAQVTSYRKKAKKIGNSTKGMYAQKPILKKKFRAGKLSAGYTAQTVNWINFYRSMFGLKAVTANSSWNTSAQIGAATLAAADKGLSHGLDGIKRPSFVSKANWKLGADATNESNLAEGVTSPYDVISGYVSDNNNATGSNAGHRLWILGEIDKVGVGQAGAYNDLRVFDTDNYQKGTPIKKLAFPHAGLMPYNVAGDGAPWTISFDDEYTGDGSLRPKASVYDNTAKKKVKVSNVDISSDSYGYYGTTVTFLPKRSQIKVNHSYTIKVSNIEDQADVSYKTRLFDLKVGGSFY